MNTSKRSFAGNTLLLVISAIAFIVVIAAFILNYNHLMLTNKGVQSSVDAAAIQAAKDISLIAVKGANFGTIALADDNNDPNNPVLGINTIFATIRLDLIIAQKLNNSTIAVAAAEDLQKAIVDSRALRKAILTACETGKGEDKNGKQIDLTANVTEAYNAMAVRTGRGTMVGPPKIRAGQTNDSSGVTNIPVPSGLGIADSYQLSPSQCINTSNGTMYKPFVDIPTSVTINNMNHTFHFQFVATGNEVTLGENNNFKEYLLSDSSGFLPPSIVQVEAGEQLTPIAGAGSEEERKKQSATLTIKALAAAGGSLHSYPSGALLVTFHGFSGPPPNTPPVDFATVKGIMNASQITLNGGYQPPAPPSWTVNGSANADLGTASPYNGWNKKNKGTWYAATKGTVSCEPTTKVQDLAYDPPAFRGRSQDDPSVVLSFIVYDWLKHAYLRPNVGEVVAALQTSLWSGGIPLANNSLHFAQPAYAEQNDLMPASFALTKVAVDGQGDPRDQKNFAKDPDAYRRQLANVFGYVPAEPTLPDTSLLIAIKQGGQVTTTNGRDPKELFALWDAIAATKDVSGKTMQAAVAAMEQATTDGLIAQGKLINMKKEVLRLGGTLQDETFKKAESRLFPMPLDSPVLSLPALPTNPQEKLEALNKLISEQTAVRNTALVKATRAQCALRNSDYALAIATAMENDRKAITALGVTEISPQQFQIIGGTFYPVTKAATKEEILGQSEIPTGQDAAVKEQDWCLLTKDGSSQMTMFTSSKSAEISHLPLHSDHIFQPVLAQSSQPQQKVLFKFIFTGDSSKNTGGKVTISSLNTTPFTCQILENQAFYQNTSGWAHPVNTDPPKLVANCVARDQGMTANGANFAQGVTPTSTGAGIPPLISEWSLRCPVPVEPCPPAKIATLPVTNIWGVNPTAGVRSDLSYVTTKTDAAGNINYYYKGQLMHFARDAGEFTDVIKHISAVRKTRGLNYGIFGGGSLLPQNPAELAQWAIAHNATSRGSGYWGTTVLFNKMTDDVAAQYFEQFGKPASNISSPNSWNDTKSYVWDAYNAGFFWVDTPTEPCAKLFAWSS